MWIAAVRGVGQLDMRIGRIAVIAAGGRIDRIAILAALKEPREDPHRATLRSREHSVRSPYQSRLRGPMCSFGDNVWTIPPRAARVAPDRLQGFPIPLKLHCRDSG
jgi:hypothetical protein